MTEHVHHHFHHLEESAMTTLAQLAADVSTLVDLTGQLVARLAAPPTTGLDAADQATVDAAGASAEQAITAAQDALAGVANPTPPAPAPLAPVAPLAEPGVALPGPQ